MRNIGEVRFSKELLEELLILPKGAKVLGSRRSSPNDSCIAIYVESEDITPRKEGEIVPEVSLVMTERKGSVTSKFINS